MSRPLVHLTGDFKNAYVTVYVDSKFCTTKDFEVDMYKVTEAGYDTLIKLETENLNLKLAKTLEYERGSFVFVNVNSVWSDFSLRKVTSNVPVKTVYDFNTLEWLVFVTIRLCKDLNGKLNFLSK